MTSTLCIWNLICGHRECSRSWARRRARARCVAPERQRRRECEWTSRVSPFAPAWLRSDNTKPSLIANRFSSTIHAVRRTTLRLLAVGALLGSSGGACRAATLCFIGNPDYSCSPVTVAAGSTQVNGISSSGRMAGFVQSPGIQAFTATSPTSATLLPGPAGTSATFAYGIGDAGSVVGSYTSSSGDHAFIESSGRYTTFDVPFAGAAGTFAYGINAAG